jgi:hypothetical protein
MKDDSDARSPDGLHESWHRLSREERRRLTAENRNDWLEFPGLSGTHLSWRKEESGSWELRSDGGAIWATPLPPILRCFAHVARHAEPLLGDLSCRRPRSHRQSAIG